MGALDKALTRLMNLGGKVTKQRRKPSKGPQRRSKTNRRRSGQTVR